MLCFAVCAEQVQKEIQERYNDLAKKFCFDIYSAGEVFARDFKGFNPGKAIYKGKNGVKITLNFIFCLLICVDLL